MELRNNYKKLGDYIREIDVRNKELRVTRLLGVSNEKYFIPSIANIVGTDLSNYKIVKRNQFAFGTVTSRNGDKLSIAILKEDKCIVSSSYVVFEVIDESKLNPDYLMMWLRREEFDRYARFMSHGSVRELFGWDKLCDVELPIPDIGEQLKYVNDYESIQNAIKIKEAINNNLNELIFARYKTFQNSAVPVKTMKLGEIATSVLGGTPSRDVPEYWNGTISWINSGKINDFRIIDASERITEIGLKKSATTLMPKHTVVLAITGATLGQFSILLIDSCANQSVIGILENDKLPYEFIYPYIRFELFELMRKQTGGAQMHINKQNVDDMLIKVPENTALMNWVNIVRPLYLEIENNCFEIEKLNTLSNLLIAKLAQQ